MPTTPPAGPDSIGVLAAEVMRLAQSAVGLHEHQADAVSLRCDLVDVATQDRREVGVHDVVSPRGTSLISGLTSWDS